MTLAISATPDACLWRHTLFSIPGQHAEHVVLRRQEHDTFVFALHNHKRKISVVKMAGSAVLSGVELARRELTGGLYSCSVAILP